MSRTPDPRCPECGEPIGMTATYCMHCSADLTEARERTDADADGYWDGAVDGRTDATADEAAGSVPSTSDSTGDEGQVLDPDGLVDDTLTVLVGGAAGLVIGIVATIALVFWTAGLALLGVVAWLVATVHLVRRRTVQDALSRGAYGVALVLLLVPLIALSPAADASVEGRFVVFVVLVVTAGIPAAIAAGIGYLASRFVPEAATRPADSEERTDGGRP